MLVSELDFYLPPELIAQTPAEPRDHSRLMVVRRNDAHLAHHRFYELPGLLRDDDLLVFNDTRVIRARLRGRKATGGAVEALLLREVSTNLWEALLKPSARLKIGSEIEFTSPDGAVRALALPEVRTAAGWLVRFESTDNIRLLLPQLGEVPLPPYIHQKPQDEAQYQTVYARSTARETLASEHALDSSAAPTAGLHFTPALLEALQARGVRFAFVTLAIGLGTFRPIQSDTLEGHEMHSEEFEISSETARIITEQRQRGGRVIAVGTTAARVLESVGDEAGVVRAQFGSTQIFITPGYQFKVVDALLTNFHLPRSTLLAMVSALAGLEKIRYAYNTAVAQGYRFFSFGDAMFIE